MPLLVVVFYFSKTPRYIPEAIIQAKIISISILTIVLPILVYYLLKTIGKTQSIFLKTPKERILPLGIYCIIILLIVKRVFPPSEILELYYFFIGVLLASLTCLFFALFNYKPSIHMIAIAGVFMFCIAFSIHFSININGSLALIATLIGAIATSRLHVKAHNGKELVVGFSIGFFAQLILIYYWL